MPIRPELRQRSDVLDAVFPYFLGVTCIFVVAVSTTTGERRQLIADLCVGVGLLVVLLGGWLIDGGPARVAEALGTALGLVGVILAATDMRGSLDNRVSAAVTVGSAAFALGLAFWMIRLLVQHRRRRDA